ncbi:hypothetical protein [Frigidibacter sp. MR17.24]|uniref:hypothetical protein n=1 Tax=Frigidibacter sp. MR17.24 TaxID=3127345 RepID=UPI003012CB3E
MRHPLLAAALAAFVAAPPLAAPLAAQQLPAASAGTTADAGAGTEAKAGTEAEAAAPSDPAPSDPATAAGGETADAAPAEPAAEAPAAATAGQAGDTPSSQPATTPGPDTPAGAPPVPPVSDAVEVTEVTACTAVIGGVAKTLGYDATDENTWSSKREKRNLGAGRCPAKVVIADMAPDLSPRERDVFCLQSDPMMGYSGLAMGDRDAMGLCEGPGKVCRFVNASGREAREMASAGASAGVQAVKHQSGAMILSGSTAGLSSAMAGIGSAATALMAAPLALAGAAASVVVVGGAVWVCGD